MNPNPMDEYKDELMRSDASLFPSYTRLTIPYCVICRQRYARAARTHRKQFLKEHGKIEMLQVHALDGVRIHKEFCENILSKNLEEDRIVLTTVQQRRLEYILANEIF